MPSTVAVDQSSGFRMNESLEARSSAMAAMSPCVLGSLIGDDCCHEERDARRQGTAQNSTEGGLRSGPG
jgi:hypothetical protein